MSFKINHPDKGFTGTHSGLAFENGTAELDNLEDAAATVLTENGFTVTGEAAVKAPKAPEGEPSPKWSGYQLDAYAAEKGISLAGAKNKDEKVELIVKAAEEAAAKAAAEAQAAADNAGN